MPEFEIATLREVVIAPYRVLYQVTDDVMALAIVHGRQDLELDAADSEE